ncbi:MAG: hypothetical protein GY896_16480 [Gammaproteobacteria bacterium]|nr:hypothetical protein [Gammaproteobacteria bacterium]
MYDTRRICILLYLTVGLFQPVAALELFGVDLESTNRDELRGAVKNAGVVLVREGGEDDWYDVYDSSSVLSGSRHLYLGFVRRDQGFAFAEYEFNGLNSKSLLRELNAKYGVAKVHAGRFVSDRRYLWLRDGIEIELASDWQNYKLRLSYINPENLADLRAEQSGANANIETSAEQVSLY